MTNVETTTWWISVLTNDGIPSSAEGDLAARWNERRDGVELTGYRSSSGRIELELDVEAESEDEARERADAWLADLAENGEWLNIVGVRACFNPDSPNFEGADFTELEDVFWINGFEERQLQAS